MTVSDRDESHRLRMQRKKAVADTVSELREVKHAFRAGVRAQKGVDL